MRIAGLVLVIACLALPGCATDQTDQSMLKSASNTTGDETSERVRARLHTELAAGYFGLGNIGVALEEVKEALRADPNYSPAHNVAGLVYAQLKEDVLAEQSYQRAVNLSPGDFDANNNYGEFLCQRKREEESIRYFLAAVRNPLYPNPDRSYVNAGVCSRRRGDMAGAENYFLMALKLRPNQAQALYQMAEITYARRDYGAAKNYLNRLTIVAPATAEVLWLGVRVERQLGDRNSEASYALQLRNKFPNSSEAQALHAGRFE
jgi:type IV pilus assembly protein PilF